MKFTYANVMSTIAMFAAVTTGTSVAATQLAGNSVRTNHIKNGQVTLADLHPSVRKRLGAAPVASGGGTGTTPTTWRDTGVIGSGQPLFPCVGNDCAKDAILGDYVGFTNTVGQDLGSGNVVLRLTGSITNNGAATATVYLNSYGASAHPVQVTEANKRAICGPFDLAPGKTFVVFDGLCTTAGTTVPASANRFVRFRATAMQPNADVSSTLVLQAKAG